jgi:cytochrome c-type biogenesis protein
MYDLAVAFILGVLSVISPCVLPVLPLIFAGSRGHVLNTVMIVAGLMLNLSILGFISGLVSFTPLKNLAYIFMIGFALLLIFDESDKLLSGFASRASSKANALASGSSFLFGFLLAFIWLPCITPFLGIAISQAALTDPVSGVVITFFYGIGMLISITAVLLAGKKALRLRESSLKLRRAAGVLIILYVLMFASGLFERVFSEFYELGL